MLTSRSIIFLLCLVGLGGSVYPQDLVINTRNSLHTIDVNSCETSLITSLGDPYYDISFHPNGKLYGVASGGLVYEIDLATGEGVLSFSFVPAFYNSLTVDDDGTFYSYDSGGAIWTYKLGEPAPVLVGKTGFTPSGDLTFFREELYAAVHNNRIIRIDLDAPLNSEVVVDENLPSLLTGIVLLAETCDEVTMYGITADEPDIPGQEAALYRIDVDNGTYEKACRLGIDAYGGASTREFLGSSTPIEVTEINANYQNCQEQGTIEITVTGGTGDYTFQHFDGPPQATGTFRNLLLGVHKITVTDEKGCFIIREIDLTGPVELSIDSIVVSYPDCQPGDANLMLIASGNGPLSYSIDGGLNFGPDSLFVVNGSSNYEVRIRDRDCHTRFERITVPPFVELALNSAENNTACEDTLGSILLTSTSINGNVRYALTGRPYQNEAIFTSLSPGNYVAYAVNTSGCTDSITGIKVNGKLKVATTEIGHTTCNLPNGNIRIDGSGGQFPYAYAVGGQPFSILNSINDLPAGDYSTMVRDARGCMAVGPSATIMPSQSLALEALRTSPVGCRNEDGKVRLMFPSDESIVAAFINGTPVSAFPEISGLSAGMHNARFINETGCVLDTMFSISTSACQVYFPSAFSPNGDGVNDWLRPFTESDAIARINNFSIFDRWGAEVYNGTNLLPTTANWGWDGSVNGEPAHAGTYIYQLSIQFLNGFIAEKKGSFQLIR